MNYDFKRAEEIAWAAGVAAALFALQVIVDTDAITDWQAWGLSILGGSVRAAAAAIIPKIVRPT